MIKFAHIADSHLGGWRQPEMQDLNMQSFKKAIDICIEEKVEFCLFAGDLFDSAFPPIEILKDTFGEFKKLKDAGIKSILIAGSHDYSISGKTFLDVLEKAGFIEICKYQENENEVVLLPSKIKTFCIYGYPGKKSSLEVHSIKKIKINEPYEKDFRILMLHTTLTEVAQGLPIDSVSLKELPKADYYALGHVHIDYEYSYENKPVIYGGPTYPNNFKEIEDLKYGCFYIVEVNGFTRPRKIDLKIIDPVLIEVEIENALTGAQKILSEIKRVEIKNKIVLLKVFGNIKQGKTSDINFKDIENYITNSQSYSFLKNTSQLEMEHQFLSMELQKKEKDKIEDLLIKRYEKENPSQYNELIIPLMESLNLEKQEDEKSAIFESRLFAELSKILKVDLN